MDGEPVPERYSRIDPWVISLDTEAEIAFLDAVFGAKETPGSRMLASDELSSASTQEVAGSSPASSIAPTASEPKGVET